MMQNIWGQVKKFSMLKALEGALVFFLITWFFGTVQNDIMRWFGTSVLALLLTVVWIFGSFFTGWWVSYRLRGKAGIESIFGVVLGVILTNFHAYLDNYFYTHYGFRIAFGSPRYGYSMLFVMIPIAYIGAIIGSRYYFSKR